MGQFHHNDTVDAYLQVIAQLVSNKGDLSAIRTELDGVGDKIRSEIEGFAESVAGAFDDIDIEDPIERLRAVLAGQNSIIKSQREQLADLQDKTQRLLGVIGYGNVTPTDDVKMDTRWHRIPHPRQVGAMVGCHVDNGDIVLDSRGLWFISAQTTFDWFAVTSKCETDIRVLDESGNLFSSTTAVTNTSSKSTNTSLVPVTIPRPGFRVQVWAKGGLGRGVLPGSDRTFLAADKRSQETD